MLDEDFQELMKHRPELRPLFERVPKTSRYQAHWRVKAKHKLDRAARSTALLKAQLALGKIAYANFGKKGFDGKGVPVVASNIQKEMKGKKFKEKKIPEWQKMVERIRRREEAIVV
jgi:hypothetical protein